jgi:hypothetical protein
MKTIKNIMNRKLVDEKSPIWIGFQHFFLSVFLFIIFSTIILFGSTSLGFDNFDFMFGTGWQIKALFFVSLFFSTTVSSMLLGKRNKNSKDVLYFITFLLFVLLFISLLI